jgi:hypothetical protein
MIKLFNFRKLKSLDDDSLPKKKKLPNLESFLKHDIYLIVRIYFKNKMF